MHVALGKPLLASVQRQRTCVLASDLGAVNRYAQRPRLDVRIAANADVYFMPRRSRQACIDRCRAAWLNGRARHRIRGLRESLGRCQRDETAEQESFHPLLIMTQSVLELPAGADGTRATRKGRP